MSVNGNFNLGRKGKQGQVDVNQLKGGIRREQIKDAKQLAIFDKYAGADGILVDKELQDFKKELAEMAKNETLSKREAKKFLKGQELQNISADDLFQFLENIESISAQSNIESAKTGKDANGNDVVILTSNNGMTTETISADKSSVIKTQQDDGGVLTQSYDSAHHLTEEVEVDAQKNTTTTSYQTNDAGEDVPLSKFETSADGTKNRITNYDDQGNPTDVTVQNGTTIEEYDVTSDGEQVLTARTEHKGLPTEKKTTFEYQENGDVIETATDAYGTTQTVVRDGKPVLIKTENSTTEIAYSENGKVETTTDNNTNAKTVTAFDEEGDRLSQEKKVDGKTYRAEYDGNGNTKVTLQNGESIEMLAKKFGCTKEALLEANGGKIRGWVGDEVVVPGEFDADDKRLTSRKSKEESIAAYKDFMAKKAAEEAAAQAAEQAKKDAAELAKEKAHRAEMQKQGQAIAEDLFNDIDGIGTSNTFGANIQRINKENVVEVLQAYTAKSPDESLAEAIMDESGLSTKKRDEAIKHIYNKLLERAKEKGLDTQQIEDAFKKAIETPPNQRGYGYNESFDPIFNSLVAGINGKSILTETEKQSIKNAPPEQLQTQTTALLENTVAGAKQSLETQLAQDGWAADLWEGIKYIGNSDNLDEKVKEDIVKYEAQVADLKSAKTPEEFKTKFKAIYGKEYDPELVKAYEKRQEQLVLANVTYGIETSFNKTMGELLRTDKLSERTQFIQSSSMGHGTYRTTATKEQVFNENFNTFAEFVGKGDIEAGKAEIEQAFKDLGLPENASMDEKYAAMHKLAKNYSQILHANTMEVTEGKGYDAFALEAESSYKAAFGLENDIAKRVADYNTSQQTGAMVVKGVAKGAAAIGLALIPGVGLATAAIGTGIISATVDTTDRLSSDVGLQDGEIGTILKNAAIDGATVYAGGQLTKMLANAKTFVKIGGQMTGDVAVGAGAEYLQTGQITLSGVAFQCVFSAAGNLVALKQMNQADLGNPNIKQDPVSHYEGGSVPPEHHIVLGETRTGSVDVTPVEVKLKTEQLVKSSADTPPTSTPDKTVLEKATVEGTQVSGGKLNAKKFETAQDETRRIAREGTVEDAVQTNRQIRLHGAKARVQSRNLRNIEYDEIGGVVRIGKENIDIATADAATLARARKHVERFSDGTRNKEQLLAAIDAREAQLANATGGVPTSTTTKPVQNVEVDTKAFDDAFNNSKFKRTSSDQPGITVDRLGTGKREQYKKELQQLCDAATTTSQLDMLTQRAKSFRSDVDRDAFLDIINARKTQLAENPVPTKVVDDAVVPPVVETPMQKARSTEFVEGVNADVNLSAAEILAGEGGALSPHAAATLEENLVNNLKKADDIEAFITQLKKRVGVDEKGNMHVYQVNGKDHAADILAKAERKLAITRQLDDIKGTLTNAKGRGLTSEELASARKFYETSNSVEDLQAIATGIRGTKKFGGSQKLLRDIEAKIDVLKAKQNASNSGEI